MLWNYLKRRVKVQRMDNKFAMKLCRLKVYFAFFIFVHPPRMKERQQRNAIRSRKRKKSSSDFFIHPKFCNWILDVKPKDPKTKGIEFAFEDRKETIWNLMVSIERFMRGIFTEWAKRNGANQRETEREKEKIIQQKLRKNYFDVWSGVPN